VITAEISRDDTLALQTLDERAWRAGLSQIVPLWLDGAPFALTYSAATGVAELRTVDPLEDPAALVK
jgi:hypothetical protein